jgi:hypothetical protein
MEADTVGAGASPPRIARDTFTRENIPSRDIFHTQGYFPYAGCDGSEPRLRGPARVAPLMERRLSKESNLATLLPRDDDHAEATTIIARLACEFGKTSPMRCFRARLNLSGGHILPRTRYLGSGRERLLFFNELTPSRDRSLLANNLPLSALGKFRDISGSCRGLACGGDAPAIPYNRLHIRSYGDGMDVFCHHLARTQPPCERTEVGRAIGAANNFRKPELFPCLLPWATIVTARETLPGRTQCRF